MSSTGKNVAKFSSLSTGTTRQNQLSITGFGVTTYNSKLLRSCINLYYLWPCPCLSHRLLPETIKDSGNITGRLVCCDKMTENSWNETNIANTKNRSMLRYAYLFALTVSICNIIIHKQQLK